MNENVKPQIVPTLLSTRNALWGAVLVGFFLALLALYTAYGRITAAQARLASPQPTFVNADYFVTSVPAGWTKYELSRNGDIRKLVMRKRDDAATPLIAYFAEREPSFAWRALDLNRTLTLTRLSKRLAEDLPVGTNQVAVEVRASDVAPIKPGISAQRTLFECGEYSGAMVFFFVQDIRYTVIGFARKDDPALAEVTDRVMRLTRADALPDFPEYFERPVLDIGALEAADFEAERMKAERELALWTLFSSRVEQEPDASLLPAIEHFRGALKHLSTLHQEKTLLDSPEFSRYREFVRRRRAIVKEWFVLLDKRRAIGDRKGAEKLAKFIIDHATLIDESLDARKARQAYEELKPKEN